MSVFNVVEVVKKALEEFCACVVAELEVEVEKVERALWRKKGCQECGKEKVRYGYPDDEEGSYCARHQRKGMVNIMLAPYPELRFRKTIARLGGTVVGEYKGSGTRVICLCRKGHTCHTRPTSVQCGQGMCLTCSGRCPEKSETEFRQRVLVQGGIVLGTYQGSYVPVKCRCKLNHECHPRPNSLQQGQGMCKKCSGMCPIQARDKFKKQVLQQGGTLIGEYEGVDTPVHCRCKIGHDCFPVPHVLRGKHSICKKCTHTSSMLAELRFRIMVKNQGGTVVGKYKRGTKPVQCICKEGHKCQTIPACLGQGRKMCPRCNVCNNCGALSTQGELCHSCGKEVIRPMRKKETIVLARLSEEFGTLFDYNRRVGSYFPDFLFRMDGYFLIVEVDEHQHQGYGELPEKKRMETIRNKLDQPCIFLRYNPDSPHSCLDYLVRRIKEYSITPPQYDENNLHVEYLFYTPTIIFEDQ